MPGVKGHTSTQSSEQHQKPWIKQNHVKLVVLLYETRELFGARGGEINDMVIYEIRALYTLMESSSRGHGPPHSCEDVSYVCFEFFDFRLRTPEYTILLLCSTIHMTSRRIHKEREISGSLERIDES